MVLFLSIHDWANVSHVFSECLKRVGVQTMALTQKAHPFNYPKMARVYKSKDQLKKACDMADVIVWMHSQYIKLPIKKLKNKRLAVFHGGTQYRKYFLRHNKIFNPLVYVSLTQTAELLNHGAKNEVWLLPAVDTDKIQPRYLEGDRRVIIAHYPRGKDKGTHEINQVMKWYINKSPEFKDRFVYKFSNKKVSWKDNLERIRKCDVYIESLSQGAATANKHDWSITALEAAALGKFIITNFNFGRLAKYRKEYGPCPLRVANSMNGLSRRIKKMLSMDWREIQDVQKQMREWVETQHSYEAIGKRLKRALI